MLVSVQRITKKRTTIVQSSVYTGCQQHIRTTGTVLLVGPCPVSFHGTLEKQGAILHNGRSLLAASLLFRSSWGTSTCQEQLPLGDLFASHPIATGYVCVQVARSRERSCEFLDRSPCRTATNGCIVVIISRRTGKGRRRQKGGGCHSLIKRGRQSRAIHFSAGPLSNFSCVCAPYYGYACFWTIIAAKNS